MTAGGQQIRDLSLGQPVDLISRAPRRDMIALGADGAACNNRLDAFTEMRQAAILHKPAGGPQAVPARTAFEFATLGGARALGIADSVGTIEVGKRADLVVISRTGLHLAPLGTDPISALVYAHTASDVRDVVVDGRIVVRDRVLQTGDTATIARNAQQELDGLRWRLGGSSMPLRDVVEDAG